MPVQRPLPQALANISYGMEATQRIEEDTLMMDELAAAAWSGEGRIGAARFSQGVETSYGLLVLGGMGH